MMRNSKKPNIWFISVLLICIFACAALAGCTMLGDDGDNVPAVDENVGENGGGSAEENKAELDYSQINIGDYVSSVSYKGLTLTLDSSDASKEDALWSALLDTAVINGYPEGAVEYYFEQTKDYYMFIANNDPEAYAMLLESRGMTEADIVEEAQALVKKDLVYLYVVRSEGISISDDEKQQLFDRYVAAYVGEYGYTAEYVKANMTELIYDSMLYDKTLEFLILNNTFETPIQSGEN